MHYIECLNEEQISQALHNSLALWGDGMSHGKAVRRFLQLKNSSGGILTMSGILDTDGNVVSALKRYAMLLDSPHSKIKTLGLGAIYTRAEFRNRGSAKFLIENVLCDARSEGYQASLLFSDIGKSYYEKLGFKALHDLTWTASALYLIKDDQLKVRMAEKTDSEKLMRLYDESFSPGHLRNLRNPSSWNFYRDRANASSDFVVSFKGQDVGYFNACIQADKMWVHEFVLANPELENQFAATLAQFSLNNKRQTIAGWLRSDNTLNGFVGETRGKATPMIKGLTENLIIPEHDSQIHFSSIDAV